MIKKALVIFLWATGLLARGQNDAGLSGSIAATFVAVGHCYFQATVENNDTGIMQSVTLSYSVNSAAPVSQVFTGLNLASYHTTRLQFSTPYFFQNAGMNLVTVSCSNPNGQADSNPANNTISQTVISLSHIPDKHVLVEEFATARCGYCPGGLTRIEQIMNTPDSIYTVPVTLHAGFGSDSMTTQEDDTIAYTLGNGCPTANIDRVLYPGQQTVAIGVNGMGDNNNNVNQWNAWKSSTEARRQVLPPCNISASNTYDSASRLVHVTVHTTFFGPVSGTFRLNCYVIEDSVTGTGNGYDQLNYDYYTPDTTGGILNPWFGVGTTNLGGQTWSIAGYVHHRVARAMLGGAWGTDQVIPYTTSDGATYTTSYSYVLPTNFRDRFITLAPFVCEYSNNYTGAGNQVYNVLSMRLNDSAAVNAPPALLPSVFPADTTVCAGRNVMLTATGGIGYVWSTGERTSTITVNAQPDSAYTVTVIFSDSTIFSMPANIHITPLPAIATPPISQAACLGSNATFSVSATGNGLSYQWKKNGTDITGATTQQYSVINLTAADTGLYAVLITGTCNTVTDSAKLSLSDTLVISGQPVSQITCAGSPVSFCVIADGGNATYRWYKDTSMVAFGASDSLNILLPAISDSGSYYCVITSSCGNGTSQTATLSVKSTSAIYFNDSICSGSTYYFGQRQITGPGTYYDTLSNAIGCDSFVVLSLSILTSVSWEGSGDTVFTGSAPITLSGGTPAGGFYSGPGVANNIFYPDSTGQGNIIVSYTYPLVNGCSDSAFKTFVVMISGITSPAPDKVIKIYPNPANDILVFDWGNDGPQCSGLAVYDIAGKKVPCAVKNEGVRAVLNTSSLSKGIYYVQLEINGQPVVKKFVRLD